jgi:raffinose/stachyose/melibiose transport system permease protein
MFNVAISLTRWRSLSFASIRFTGLANYVYMLRDPGFLTAMKNVVVFGTSTLAIQIALGLWMTMLLRDRPVGKGVFELLLVAPAMLSSPVVAYCIMRLLEPNSGLVNTALGALGLGDLKRIWLGDPSVALLGILAANVYQWTGFGIIYYRAGMAQLSSETLDAAKVDGAGPVTTFFRIIFPLLRNTHFTMITMGVIGTLKCFDLVYIMTQGGPAGSTQFPMIYLYQRFSQETNYGLASAVSVFIVATALVASVVLTSLQRGRN